MKPCVLAWLLSGLLGGAESLTVQVTPAEGEVYPLAGVRFVDEWGIEGQRDGQAVRIRAQDLVSLELGPATPRQAADSSHVRLATGEVLVGTIDSVEGESLWMERPAEKRFMLPLSAISAIVLRGEGTGSSRHPPAPAVASGDQLTLQNGDVLLGTFLGLDLLEVQWQRDGQPLAIAREQVVAIRLDPALLDYTRPKGFFGVLRFSDGSLLHILAAATRGDRLRVVTAAGPTLEIPVTQPAREQALGVVPVAVPIDLTFRNGRVVYLSDREPMEAVAKPFLDARMPHRLDRSVLGTPLAVGGKVYAKGLGVRSHSALRYGVEGFDRFQAIVGLDERAGPEASVRFLVQIDGRVAFDSGEVLARSQLQRVDVSLGGSRQLDLVVDFAKRGDVQDYADWCDARLIR